MGNLGSPEKKQKRCKPLNKSLFEINISLMSLKENQFI